MLIKVKVFPNSKNNEILQTGEGSFEIKVKAKPVGGEANKAVADILTSYFKIPPSKLRLIKGFKKRNKIYEVDLEK